MSGDNETGRWVGKWWAERVRKRDMARSRDGRQGREGKRMIKKGKKMKRK